jgi:hypothetical protein
VAGAIRDGSGSRAPDAADAADKVRKAREKGLSVRKIAAKYGAGLATVQRITTAV